jgi:RND superfamily putative drug exporter
MANRLYALGRFSYRRRRLVAVLWLLLLVGLCVSAATLKGAYSSSFAIPGSESQHAIDTLHDRFPASGLDAASATIVLAAPKGQTLDTPARKAAVAAVLAEVRKDPHVVSLIEPFSARAVSRDGRIAVARAVYDLSALDIGKKQQDPLFASAEPGRAAGLTVEFSGEAARVKVEPGIGELFGVAAAALVLLVLFGSFVAVGIPLLTALLGVGIGAATITTLTGFLTLSQTTPVLGLMLGLAVGIDYALFIMSRFRDELLHGRDGEEAAGHAVATAGSAVVFAGLTVLIALLGLLVVRVPFLSYMGVGAAGTIVIAVLVALTLLPALLGFSGRRVLGRRAVVATDEVQGSAGQRWAEFIARRPVVVLAAAVAGLALLAVPALSLKTGLPDEGSLSPQNTNRKAYDLLSEAFGPGSNGPLVVVVETAKAGTAAVTAVRAELGSVEGVVAVLPPVANPANDTFLLTVIPAGSPASDQTKRLVARIRTLAPQLETATSSTIAVSGQSAVQIDVAARLSQAMPIYLLVVVGLALVLLTIVFRSVLIPIKAVLGFLLTLASTFGAVVALFQFGWLSGPLGITTTGPILSILPIFMIGIIFGLAMDYEVFLVTRIREEHVHGAAPAEAVVDGFGHGARVVSGAAIIMICVFASFMLSPDATTKSLGFAFAFGIAVDAFVVRMTIVPAALVLLGRSAWWLPRWLDRLVPRVDVEGEGLRVIDEAERTLQPYPSADVEAERGVVV